MMTAGGRHGLFTWPSRINWAVLLATISTTASTPPKWLLTPADHASLLHPAGCGRVTLARRLSGGSWQEHSLPITDLGYAVRHLNGAPDIYLSQNRFFGHRRLVSRLAQLDALFVDLDFHKTDLASASPRHVLDLALEALDRERLPQPSFSISTGRGLALIWLHRPVPRQALPRWRACQKVLCDALRHLGADRLATDAARVLRLIGTRNSRSGMLVEALTPAGESWDFDLLAEEILPVSRAEIVALRLERARRRAAGPGVIRPARYFTDASLWELRLAELQRLLEHRWLGVLPPGQRDLWMLLAGTAMSYLVPAPLVSREVCALARQVTAGAWDDREAMARMSAVACRAEQAARGERIDYRGRRIDPRYHFRTETILDLLAITEGEMRACGFRHLVTPEIRREHHRLGEERRRRAVGAQPREQYEARSLGRLKPWEAEGVSRATWYRRRETGPCRCMVA